MESVDWGEIAARSVIKGIMFGAGFFILCLIAYSVRKAFYFFKERLQGKSNSDINIKENSENRRVDT